MNHPTASIGAHTYPSRERCDAVTFSVDNNSDGTDAPTDICRSSLTGLGSQVLGQGAAGDQPRQ